MRLWKQHSHGAPVELAKGLRLRLDASFKNADPKFQECGSQVSRMRIPSFKNADPKSQECGGSVLLYVIIPSMEHYMTTLLEGPRYDVGFGFDYFITYYFPKYS